MTSRPMWSLALQWRNQGPILRSEIVGKTFDNQTKLIHNFQHLKNGRQQSEKTRKLNLDTPLVPVFCSHMTNFGIVVE